MVTTRAESDDSGITADCSGHLQVDIEAGTAAIWELLERVKDPEIPVLSLAELGVLRGVEKNGNKITISITPTYSGCPAMETMREDIKNILAESGYPDNEVRTVLSPAWTTDWMSAEGKKKLEQFGIAPPAHTQEPDSAICCPRCKSENTQLLSEFGSTACKAMYQCQQCKDTFCYFKVI